MTRVAPGTGGRAYHPLYKKKHQPKHRKDGTFKRSKLGKYNNRGFRLDGRFFHSEAEANRYMQLKVLAEKGIITHLECQPAYPIHIDGTLICTYYADFRYFIRDPQTLVIEDVKGQRTETYRLKKKLVEAKHKIRISELPGNWLAHYDGKHALDCMPIIEQLTKEKNQRAKERREKRRLATKAAQAEAEQQSG